MTPLRQRISNAKTACYRSPKDELSRLIRWGPTAYFRIDAWKRQMEEAAKKLPRVENGNSEKTETLKVWFLTGRRCWYQTAFCAWTLATHSSHKIQPIILDDGTLKEDNETHLRRIFPHLSVQRKETCDRRFQTQFPLARYPNLHFWRTKQLLFRKLTDIHPDSEERRLFLDSDMLFFRRPDELDSWITSNDGFNIVQRDCWESYGYSRALTENLCGHRLPEAVNIGIFSIHGPSIDWDQVEFWIGEMTKNEGTRYNITQCTCAMLLAGLPLRILDSEKYNVLPSCISNSAKIPVLSHYVSDSKPLYFGQAWKLALRGE